MGKEREMRIVVSALTRQFRTKRAERRKVTGSGGDG